MNQRISAVEADDFTIKVFVLYRHLISGTHCGVLTLLYHDRQTERQTNELKWCMMDIINNVSSPQLLSSRYKAVIKRCKKLLSCENLESGSRSHMQGRVLS